MSFKEKLEKLGYKQYMDTYTKKINNWLISFVLDYYENCHDEMIEEIVEYYISPIEIDRTTIDRVLNILEHDLKELGYYD